MIEIVTRAGKGSPLTNAEVDANFTNLKTAADAAQADATQALSAAAGKVSKSGDTMAGPLTLPGTNPTDANHAARKAYVDAQRDTRLSLSGGTLTGNVTISRNTPILSLDSPTPSQRRVDFLTNGVRRWTIMANAVAENGNNAGSNLIIAPADDNGNQLSSALSIDRASRVVTFGAIPLLPSTDPVNANDAARKAYVDAQRDTRLSLSGGTLTGNLTISTPAPIFVMNGPATANRRIDFRTNGVRRWSIMASNAAENGNNSGSPLVIEALDDNGNTIGNALSIDRATTVATFGAIPILPATNPTDANHAARKAYVDERTTVTQDGAGAVARAVTDRLKDWVSVKDFGAVGDGTTDDTGAINAARSAVPGPVLLPAGTYKTSLAPAGLSGRFSGVGRIVTGTTKRAPSVAVLSDASPYTPTDEDSPDTAFNNGDWSRPHLAFEHRVLGAATLGQPATGYRYTPHACAVYGYLYNESGHNAQTDGNEGRTAAVAYRTRVFQAGQGDAVAYNASVFVTGTRAGSTSFLANPAGVMFNGDMQAGANGVYLNAGEMILHDAGYDVAGIGWVVNLNRTNATGAKGAYWAGFRAQSVGSAKVDAFFSGTGKARIGLDFSSANFASEEAAVVLKTGQRIYLAASNASPIASPAGAALGDAWLDYDSANSAVRLVASNATALLASSEQVTSLARLVVRGSGQNGVKLQPVAGSPPFVTAEGDAANVQLSVYGKGAGGLLLELASGKLGFFGFAPQPKQTVTGSKGGNAALASLLAVLAAYGLITDNTT